MPPNDLIKPRSRLEVLEALLEELRTRNWPLTDFEPGSVGRTLVESIAAAIADLETLRVEIARSGFLSTASGGWLDLLAEDFFGVKRNPPIRARIEMLLRENSGLGPYTINPRQLLVYSEAKLRYQNVNGGVLLPRGTLQLEFEAEEPGAAYNIPSGARIELHTPLPGVTVEVAKTIEPGVNEESDEALRERCRMRWHTLGGGTRAAYRFWALSAAPQVRQAHVLDQHPDGQGSVVVVVWGGAGEVPQSVLDQVQTYIQERAPLTARVRVVNATQVTIPVSATIWTLPGYIGQAKAEGENRLAALQERVGIGGKLYRSAIIEALFAEGVVNVNLRTPGNDIFLKGTEVPVFSLSLEYQEER